MKIVIIGAGVAGLAIGWRLAEAGQEVTVLERTQPGPGATWASAGMLAVTAESFRIWRQLKLNLRAIPMRYGRILRKRIEASRVAQQYWLRERRRAAPGR